MRTLLVTLTFLMAGFYGFAQEKSGSKTNCGMAVTYSQMAYKKFKQALKSNDSANTAALLKQAVSDARESSAYTVSPDCHCSFAEVYALNAASFGEKAIKETDAKARKVLIKKAMNNALNVLSGVNQCK